MENIIAGTTGNQRNLSPTDISQEGRAATRESVLAGTELNITSKLQTAANGHSNNQQDANSLARETPRLIPITYKIRERGAWRTSHRLDVDPSNPSEVERVAVKYMRKKMRLFDTELNILTPRDCFEAATAEGRNTILLIPEAEIYISEQLENSIPESIAEREPPEEIRKRGRRRG
ncbi:hypothetical protein CC80DRAFT_556251 [Byssothecium circinans]|uniref:Uncharacterized protein n=1 Tax=Byssothecium circinans TaxID=147558 RepID=A0A6A5T6G7_9PLEO|nr:hypothetical protein CC80DRAFT_556251 [Byssothecium circinans]